MSWSAHQFESYVLQKHFGEKIAISYLAIVVGDMIPDSFTKVWVYGFTVGSTHFGASDPARFHRGWPGAGFTHSLMFGVVIATIVWLVGRPRPWAIPWAIGIVTYEFDFGWTGPDCLHKVPPARETPAWLIGGALAVVGCCALLWLLVLRRAQLPVEPALPQADAAPSSVARTASGQSVTTPSRTASVPAGGTLVRHQE